MISSDNYLRYIEHTFCRPQQARNLKIAEQALPDLIIIRSVIHMCAYYYCNLIIYPIVVKDFGENVY